MKKGSRNKGFRKGSAFQITAATLTLAVSVAFAYPSIAEDASSQGSQQGDSQTWFTNGDTTESPVNLSMQVQKVDAAAAECADLDNPNGLGAAQKAATDDRFAFIGAVTNTDKLFDAGNKNGCFNALTNFPNLSVAIPSLSSIGDALKKTLVDYATRKVCTAVNDALSEVISPINGALDKLSQNGQIDLSGKFNTKMREKLYKIDPELGRVAAPINSEYSWDLADVTSSTVGNGTGNNNGGNGTGNGNNTQSRETGSNLTPVENINAQSSEPKSVAESTKDAISNFFN